MKKLSKTEIEKLLTEDVHAASLTRWQPVPHGDGPVQIWAKLDAKNRVRAVWFSFDGEEPPTDCIHSPAGTISEEKITP